VPTTIAATGSVARLLSGASKAPRMAAKLIDSTMAESIRAWLLASRSTLRRPANMVGFRGIQKTRT